MHAGECGPAHPRSKPLTLTLAASAWRAHQRRPLFFVTVSGEGAVRSGGADGNILQHRITADNASQQQQLKCDAAMNDACGMDAAADGLPGQWAASNPALSPEQVPRQDPGGGMGAAANGPPGPMASEPDEKLGRVAFHAAATPAALQAAGLGRGCAQAEGFAGPAGARPRACLQCRDGANHLMAALK